MGSFALFAPAMVFPALALLLLTSPPRRLGVRLVLALGVLYALAWIAVPGGLVDETMKAWAVIATALFVPLALRRIATPLDAAIGAGLAAAGGVLLWYAALRISPRAALAEVEHQMRAMYRLLGDISPADRGELNAASDQVVQLLAATPAVTMLIGLGGFLVAWRWYHIFAEDPQGDPPAPFNAFRFSDHLVWLLVAGMAGVVAQLGGRLAGQAIWPANLLLFAGMLYVVRGLAVVRWRTGAWSGLVLLVAVITVLFLAPFALTALFGIGLADTWLDFRRRPAPAPGD